MILPHPHGGTQHLPWSTRPRPSLSLEGPLCPERPRAGRRPGLGADLASAPSSYSTRGPQTPRTATPSPRPATCSTSCCARTSARRESQPRPEAGPLPPPTPWAPARQAAACPEAGQVCGWCWESGSWGWGYVSAAGALGRLGDSRGAPGQQPAGLPHCGSQLHQGHGLPVFGAQSRAQTGPTAVLTGRQALRPQGTGRRALPPQLSLTPAHLRVAHCRTCAPACLEGRSGFPFLSRFSLGSPVSTSSAVPPRPRERDLGHVLDRRPLHSHAPAVPSELPLLWCSRASPLLGAPADEAKPGSPWPGLATGAECQERPSRLPGLLRPPQEGPLWHEPVSPFVVQAF